MRSPISALFLAAALALTVDARVLPGKRSLSHQANACVQSLNHVAPLFTDLSARVNKFQVSNGLEYIQNDILQPSQQVADNMRREVNVACCNNIAELYSEEDFSAIKNSLEVVGAPFVDFYQSLQKKREEISFNGEQALNTVKMSAAVIRDAVHEFDMCLTSRVAPGFVQADHTIHRKVNADQVFAEFVSYYP